MAILRPIKINEQREPERLSDRAIDNLRFIRETMERSTSFTAVPGYGGILMGATAVAAAYVANRQVYLVDALTVWFVEAVLAFAIGLLAMWQKSKIAGQSLFSTPARKFAFGSAPPFVAGIAIVLGLWKFGHYYEMAPVCMLTYGAAVACGGAFSVRVVPVMGWLFMALGAIAFLLPTNYANTMMAITFGGLHIVFGAIIARRYGG
ncbi:MAG: hypothetical protein K1X52_05685 [Pyrinomonadaceae bacterium]|nr:hypothetical protein [Pyrinomonadaceae bacterium]